MPKLTCIEGARQKAQGWTPKECLQDLITDIDNGREVKTVIVLWTEPSSGGSEVLHYHRAGFSHLKGGDQDMVTLGYLELFAKAFRAACLGRGPWAD